MENQKEVEVVTEGNLKNNGFYNTKLSSKWKAPKIIFALLTVVLLSATAALAARAWDPTWNPFRPSPEEILNRAMIEMMETKTMHSELDLKATLRTLDGAVSTKIKLISESNGSDELTPKFRSDFDITMISDGVRMFFTGEIIGLGDLLYVKADTIPLPIMTSVMMMGIDLEQWRESWIAIDPKDTGISFTPDPEKRDEFKKKIVELFEQHPLFISERQFSDKVIDGEKVYHYLFKLNRDNTQIFLTEMIRFQENLNQIDFNGEEMNEMMELIDMVATAPIEIYIDKEDFLIRKIVVKEVFEINNDEIGSGELDIDLEVMFSRFGEPVDIIAPENSSSIREIFYSPIMNELSRTREMAMDSKIKSALGQARAIAEIVYSMDGRYDNLCASATSLGVIDGLDLQSEIIDNGGTVTCYAFGDDYCLSSSLNLDGFWCIDSEGESRATDSSCVGASDRCR